MKCLVTGAGGQLASSLVDRASPSIQIDAIGIDQLDITNAVEVDAAVDHIRPDVILNAAAWTDVDGAESDESLAMAVNRDGPAHLAEACARHGSRLIHVSTDFVFDGSGTTPCRIDDPTSPLTVYGKSKLAGEQAIQERLGAEAVIVRTAWLYAAHGQNFVRTMLKVMSERDHIKVVADQRGTPTSSTSLADAMWQLLDCGATGLYHWTDAGEATWHEFAVAIHEEACSHDLLDHHVEIQAITSDQWPTAAHRPHYSVLDISRSEEILGRSPRSWRQELVDVIRSLAATEVQGPAK
ncbi:MAG: dTDP-4-dehydrorhamnose reductase [Phycisphaerales bacterium]|nr:dTDP-4-dehydrorhamnose reductase [Phycisphaerales bacterium]